MQMKLFWWLLVENSFLLNFPHTTKFSVKTPGHPHDFWCNKNFIISKTSNNLYKLWRSQDIFIFFTCLSFCPNLWAPHFCLGSWVEGSYLKKKGETDVFLDRSPIFDQSNFVTTPTQPQLNSKVGCDTKMTLIHHHHPPPPTTTHTNSMSAISQLLLTRFQPNFKLRFLRLTTTTTATLTTTTSTTSHLLMTWF